MRITRDHYPAMRAALDALEAAGLPAPSSLAVYLTGPEATYLWPTEALYAGAVEARALLGDWYGAGPQRDLTWELDGVQVLMVQTRAASLLSTTPAAYGPDVVDHLDHRWADLMCFSAPGSVPRDKALASLAERARRMLGPDYLAGTGYQRDLRRLIRRYDQLAEIALMEAGP